MSASAGRVMIIPKGTYDASVTYTKLDAVYYSGSTYICKAQTTGNAPTNTTYWQLMAQGTQSAQIAGNYYGTCDTAGATASKVVTVPASENFVLQVGDIVGVRFTYDNTANNPTINVNNSGAKPIYYNKSAVSTGTLWAGGEADRDTLFMYDGTNWVWIAHDVDLNTDALADLTDTNISSPSNGQALVYNSTSGKWENATPVNSLSGLSDVNISNASNGQELVYDSTAGKWKNKGKWLSVSCVVGDTTATFTDNDILTTSVIEDYCENTSGKKINVEQIVATTGQIVYHFDALEEATTFYAKITNL